MKRMWINQPSTLQPLHHLHGTNVLAAHEYDDTWRIYFLSGPVVSQQCSGLCLSEGWVGEQETRIEEVVREVVPLLEEAGVMNLYIAPAGSYYRTRCNEQEIRLSDLLEKLVAASKE